MRTAAQRVTTPAEVAVACPICDARLVGCGAFAVGSVLGVAAHVAQAQCRPAAPGDLIACLGCGELIAFGVIDSVRRAHDYEVETLRLADRVALRAAQAWVRGSVRVMH